MLGWLLRVAAGVLVVVVGVEVARVGRAPAEPAAGAERVALREMADLMAAPAGPETGGAGAKPPQRLPHMSPTPRPWRAVMRPLGMTTVNPRRSAPNGG